MSAARNETQTRGQTYLDRSKVAAARTIEFAPSANPTSGSSQKTLQAIRLVKSVFRQKLRCIVMQRSASVAITCPEATEADILQACAVAEQRLTRFPARTPYGKDGRGNSRHYCSQGRPAAHVGSRSLRPGQKASRPVRVCSGYDSSVGGLSRSDRRLAAA